MKGTKGPDGARTAAMHSAIWDVESADAGNNSRPSCAAEIIRTLDRKFLALSASAAPTRRKMPLPACPRYIFFSCLALASRVSAVNSYRRIRAAPALSG